MLDKFFNPENSRPIIIKERLPQKDRKLKQMAEKKGYITTTKNCQVKVFYKTQKGFLRSCALKKEQLDNGNSFFVRQRKQQFAQHTKDNEFNNNTTQVSQTTPSNVSSRNVIPQAPNISKSSLKRLRSSPNDDDGCATLTARYVYCVRCLKRSSQFNITPE